jgi:hypothetical protein
MVCYRAYIVGSDGHFVGYELIACDDDNQAVEQARRLLNERNIEVWCSNRLVTLLTAKRPGAFAYEMKDGCLKPKR